MTTVVQVPEARDARTLEAVVVAVLVETGEPVRTGQPVVELAIDKGDVELPAPTDGVIEEILVPAGATVGPGTGIVRIGPARPDVAPREAVSSRPSTGGDGEHRAAKTSTGSRIEKLTPLRKVVARTMMDSLASTAQLTGIVPADVTRLMAARAAVKEDVKRSHGVSLSPLAFLARATCMALQRHPVINASIDVEAGTVTFHDHVGLGMAVDTPKGLMVVNIPNAHDLTVVGLGRAIGDMAARARSGSLTPGDVRGMTFTISNTGSNGTVLGTPILTPPQSAMLGTYAIERRPVVVADGPGEAIAIRSVLNLALTYDHRLIDGAGAGRFLQELREIVEHHDFVNEL